MRNGNREDGIETCEITIEVNGWTARRLMQLAWEHETTPKEIAQDCCRYGAHEYERALNIS